MLTPSFSYNDTKPATKKQIEEVKRIISIKSNYYQVLKVERKATTKDIEKSYKKLILTIHPDRNPHEQASEAFNSLFALLEVYNFNNAILKVEEEESIRSYADMGTGAVKLSEASLNLTKAFIQNKTSQKTITSISITLIGLVYKNRNRK